MKTITLMLLMLLMVGCTVDADPMRNAAARERTVNADNSQTAQNAQIERAQQADTDARNAQARLEGLQTQNAIVQGQAVVAHSNAISSIVASTNETTLLLADKLIEATRPDYTPLYVAMFLVSVLIVAYMLIVVRRTAPKPEIAPLPKLLPSPHGTELWLYPNGELQQIWIEPFDSRVLAPGDPMYRKLLTGGK